MTSRRQLASPASPEPHTMPTRGDWRFGGNRDFKALSVSVNGNIVRWPSNLMLTGGRESCQTLHNVQSVVRTQVTQSQRWISSSGQQGAQRTVRPRSRLSRERMGACQAQCRQYRVTPSTKSPEWLEACLEGLVWYDQSH